MNYLIGRSTGEERKRNKTPVKGFKSTRSVIIKRNKMAEDDIFQVKAGPNPYSALKEKIKKIVSEQQTEEDE